MKEEYFGDTAIGYYNDFTIKIRHPEEWEGEDDLATAKEAMDGARSYFGEVINKGLLVIGPTIYKNREILNYYQQRELNEAARAIIVTSFGAKVFGNMYLKLAKNKKNEAGRNVPTKLFTDIDKGVAWLYNQIELYQKK